MDNVEKVAKAGSQMKGVIVKYVSMLDDICREMLDLRRQIHPVHGLFNDETSKPAFKHFKISKSNLHNPNPTLLSSKTNQHS